MGKRSVFHKSIKGRMAGRYRLRKVRNPRPASTSTRVSIITAKRAYDDLERDGFVQTTQGKGTFVSLANLDRLREVAMSQIEEKLAEAVGAAKAIGLGLEEFQQIIEELYREA